MLCCEVSLFPMDSVKSDEIIKKSVRALDGLGLQYSVGPVSTHIDGDPDKVWEGLRAMYEQAQSLGKEMAMVINMTNGLEGHGPLGFS